MSRSFAVCLQMIITVWLVGCATTAPLETATSLPTPGEQIDLRGTWVLEAGIVSGGPIPNLDSYSVILELTPTLLRGRAACNLYGMRITLDGRTIEPIDGLDMTAMSCGDEPDAIDSMYVDALTGLRYVDTITATDLVLTGPDVRLDFRPALPDEVDALD